ncbi:Alpha/Beta hydrolase protein [Pseudomassariella vexata]|uniref:Carboxylic ester hydrolase n=1 Tax=Pseudomassariella vexata TaxID=1141098 RepID=A0A1Y2D9A9_9PEZI|nr:Alpha/Beta hydrolase protein [Pseudomassariella vexata]ORY55843.1 Alpha/Beta hydrolase protein [Pseudomassariella vexata]
MSMLKTLALFSLFVISFASPVNVRQNSGPSVAIRNGTVVGSSSGGVDSFRGIPFAQPPVGNLRLRKPQPLVAGFSGGVFTTTGTPRSCPQYSTETNTSSLSLTVAALFSLTPLGQAMTTPTGEDCLTLNVQRPSTATSSSRLPVVFWIFGGGFQAGSTSMYDGTNFITKSMSLGEPVIFVAVNYRVSAFGFLAGRELSAEGSTNLGLRDQRQGLKWVQENIAAFGGDPDRVTIWGESAGSISVFDHTIINGGDNRYNGRPLFRGAIMDSGSVVPALSATAAKAQNVFDSVASAAGCGASADKLACLRSVDYGTLLNAQRAVPSINSYRSLDLSYLPRPDPSDNFFPRSPELAVAAGRFAKVPIIIGDQEDEGTVFALSTGNITTNAQLNAYLASYFPGNPNALSDVSGLTALYPNQPLLGQPAGSPFRTGAANNIYPQFKRLAALLGDIAFTLTRRVYLAQVASQVPSYSYLSTYLYGTPVVGTFHGTDVLVAFGIVDGGASTPAQTTQTYFINFINNLDPNLPTTPAPLINWPRWSTASPNLLNFGLFGNNILADDFRQNAFNYLRARPSSFRI